MATILAGCVSGTGPKFGGQSTPTDVFEPIDRILTVHCFTERSGKTVFAKGMAGEYRFRLSPVCNENIQVTEKNTSTVPLNLMFVVDLTSSMQPSIDGIKNGILTLSRSLLANGWDAKFAAIGFRDDNQILRAPLGDANQLFNFLNTGPWQASGGDDYPEGGQIGLMAGLTELEKQANAQDRADADHALLYVSNGPAYVEGDHGDFSTDALADDFSQVANRLQGFRFYFSVDTRFLPDGEKNDLNAPMPDAQMVHFASQMGGINSKQLYYPLTTQVLGDFSKEFKQAIHYKQLACELERVSFVSAEGQGVPGRDTKNDLLPIVQKGTPVRFASSPDPATVRYSLTIERCCKLDGDADCRKRTNASIPHEFLP